MGSSLGYGHGMEYQYFDAPQPSQPIRQLRRDRLQQLRQQRNQRLLNSNRSTIFPNQGQKSLLLGEKLKQLLSRLSVSLIQFQQKLSSPADPANKVHSNSSAAEKALSRNAEGSVP